MVSLVGFEFEGFTPMFWFGIFYPPRFSCPSPVAMDEFPAKFRNTAKKASVNINESESSVEHIEVGALFGWDASEWSDFH